MKLKFLLSLVLIMQTLVSMGQYENVWAFSHHAGLDFNSGTPVEIQTMTTGYGESAASVCDSNGQLLFYTEGDTLWNRNGDVMSNGQGLSGLPAMVIGLPGFPDYSATSSALQGAFIAPMPGNPDRFYVFSMSSFESVNPGRMTYSIVDMQLNDGLGDVDTGFKAVVLDSNLTERMIGITGNSHNVWIIVASQFPSGSGVAMEFKAYELTTSGLNTTPIVSSVSGVPPQTVAGRIAGQFAISPDRRKLALSRTWDSRFEIYDFDPQTGLFSNQLILDGISPSIGLCFSPDSRMLYLHQGANAEEPTPGIYQLDLNTYTSAAILASKLKVATLPANMGGVQLKLGPDGKIYFHYLPLVGTMYPVIGVVQEPNLAGLAAGVDDSVLVLSNKNPYFAPLPNVIPAFRFQKQTVAGCPEDTTLLRALDTSGYVYEWSDGATGLERPAISSGTYWVRYQTMPYLLNTDTFEFVMAGLNPQIRVEETTLSTLEAYAAYQWLLNGTPIPGADQPTYTVIERGDYQVVVSSAGGCVDTSEVYTVTSLDVAELSGVAGRLRVYPNPAENQVKIQAPVRVRVTLSDLSGRAFIPLTEAETISLEGLPAGVYLLRIFDHKQMVLLKAEKLVIRR